MTPRRPIHAGRRARRLNLALAACASVVVPFVAIGQMMLVHFYVRGAFLWDSGLLGSLIWHSDLHLTPPASVGGPGFLATHFSPVLLFASAASRLVPLSMAQWFAVCAGATHALLALAVFWVLIARFDMRDRFWPWIAAALAAAFALSGLALAIARYPHFEMLIPAFFLLFLAARAAGHNRLAAVFFGLGLLTREDAGLHYALILGLLAAYRWWTGVAPRRLRPEAGFAAGFEAGFAAAGVIYVGVALLAQHIWFPGDSAFTRIYLGNPPLAHLSWHRLGIVLLNLAINRPYIVLPAIGAAIWAARRHNPAIVLGYVACLPWLFVHLLAASTLASMLASYYAFPFVIALAWPLVTTGPSATTGPNVMAGEPGIAAETLSPDTASRHRSQALTGFSALLALSFVPAMSLHNPGRLTPSDMLATPSFATQARIERAVKALVAARPRLGTVLVDNSIAALAPRSFTRAEVASPPGTGTDSPDVAVWFEDGYDAAQLRHVAGLPWRYAVPGTPIRLAARRPLTAASGLGGLLPAN